MVYYYKSERDRTAVAIDESVKIRKIHPTITIDRKKEMAIGPFMYCYLEFMTMLRNGVNRVFTEYQIIVNGRVASKAVIMSKVPIYKFMPRNGLHLGFCFTEAGFRGMGYYPLLLKYIQNQYIDKDIYMIVDEENIPSIKGIEKAGFKKFGFGIKEGKQFILKNYV